MSLSSHRPDEASRARSALSLLFPEEVVDRRLPGEVPLLARERDGRIDEFTTRRERHLPVVVSGT